MEIRNVLERLKLLTNDDREDLLLMLSGDAVQRLKARLCCTVEEENAHEEALCAAAAAQAAYQFWLLEEAASPKSLTAGEVRAEFDKGSERAQQMTAEISGEKVVCRGVVHRLKEDKTALQAETETFGGAMKPLYVYFGDGKVLCGAENARLTVGGETFRVLYAEEKSGICGALYVRAVLEKEEKDDGNGA